LHQFRADVHTYWPPTPIRSTEWHVCMSTLSHTSCGMLGESFVAKDQLRTSQVCTIGKSTKTWSASPGPNLPHHWVYGAAYGNGRRAQRIYHKCFPNTQCPDYHMYASVDCRLWETGTFAVNRHSTGQGRSVHMLQFYEDILQHFEKNPSTSTHVVGHAVGVDHYLVWNVVPEQHQQNVQALLGHNDYLCRDQRVHWFVHQTTKKPNFPAVVWFTDEACFTREGIFNNHNSHVWAEANPHAASAHCHQKFFVVNVWALIWP